MLTPIPRVVVRTIATDSLRSMVSVSFSRPCQDGDGRRQAFDEVYLGFLHLIQELAGIGGEGLDVLALPLGVDRVEGERRFAGAA